MMETKEQERKWHLIRNDNGEWISDENVVFLTAVEARSLQIKAKLAGKKLKIQHGYDGTLWCYKHEFKTVKNIIMEKKIKVGQFKKTEEQGNYERENIIQPLKKRVPYAPSGRPRNIDLPNYISFTIIDDSKKLLLYIEKQAVCNNMQTDNAAFEGWAVCLKAWLADRINYVELKWDKPSFNKEKGNSILHYHRFLYRVLRFSEQYFWFSINEENKEEIAQFEKEFVNLRNNSYTKEPDLKLGHNGKISETVVEFMFATVLKSSIMTKFDLTNVGRQFPVGVQKNEKPFFTGGLSAIDLWGTKGNKLTIIELKYNGSDSNNIKVGIISELFLYSNIMVDIVKGKILPPSSLSKVNAEHSFYSKCKKYTQIHAEMLSDKYHPLVENDKVFEILNDRTQRESDIPVIFKKTKYSFDLKASFID